MTQMTILITRFRMTVLDWLMMAWRTRRGPCLHPLYCCQLPPDERWLIPAAIVRLVLVLSAAAILIAAVTVLSAWLAWLVLEFG